MNIDKLLDKYETIEELRIFAQAQMKQIQSLTKSNKELEEKLEKLNDFNQSEKADKINPIQKSLLVVQAGAMYTYLECLKARLERL